MVGFDYSFIRQHSCDALIWIVFQFDQQISMDVRPSIYWECAGSTSLALQEHELLPSITTWVQPARPLCTAGHLFSQTTSWINLARYSERAKGEPVPRPVWTRNWFARPDSFLCCRGFYWCWSLAAACCWLLAPRRSHWNLNLSMTCSR